MSKPVDGRHPLRVMLEAAVAGSYPPVDGRVEVLAADEAGTEAIVEFTGHSVVLSERCRHDELIALGADGFGGATHPDVQRAVAGASGHIGCLDVVLFKNGRGAGLRPGLERRDDLSEHPRVARAHEHRRGCEVYADEHGVAVVGRGLVGRREMAVELLGSSPAGLGFGGRLIESVLDVVPAGEVVFAQVSPGNAASLRAFLRCGFTPLCAEVLVHPGGVVRR
jgi:hypothetical protein